jgi:hypothetical protein
VGDKTVGSCSRQAAHPTREDQRTVRPRVAPAGRAPPSPRDPHLAKTTPQEGRRCDRCPLASFTMAPTAPTLTPAEAPIAGEVVELGVDTERAAGGEARHCPAAPAVIAYPGWRSPGCSRVPRRWRGPRSNPDRPEAGESAPQRVEVRVAAGEAADRSGAAPKLAGSERAAPEQGSKRAAPEQGLSSRPAKKPRVRSKM